MNFPRLTAATVLLALVVGLAGCTDEDKPTGTPTSSAAPTASASGPPTADLSKLTVQKLTGVAPKQLPEWKPGGNATEYSLETLRYLVAIVGLEVPVSYAIYKGDPEHIVDCSGSTNVERAAKETVAALYCTEIDGGGVLLVPNNNWPQTDPWDTKEDGVHPLHGIIRALADVAKTQVAHKNYCFMGVIYAGITLAQPVLRESVAAYLASAGGPKEVHSAYANAIAGKSQPC